MPFGQHQDTELWNNEFPETRIFGLPVSRPMRGLAYMASRDNLVPRAHVPFGQHQDTELWNNQFPETKILGLPVSRRMRGLVFMASRDKFDVDTFHKGIEYALEKLGKSKFGFERTAVSNFKSKRRVGSGNELVEYSRVPRLGAD